MVARRGRNGTAEAEEHAFQRVLERMLCRDGIRIGAYDYISHYREHGACHIITSLCFGNRCELGIIKTQDETIPGYGLKTAGMLFLCYNTDIII